MFSRRKMQDLVAQYVRHSPASIIRLEVAIGCHPPMGESYGLHPHAAFPALPPCCVPGRTAPVRAALAASAKSLFIDI